MQGIKKILLLVLIVPGVTSCKKDHGTIVATASLNVVNASPGIANAKVRTPNVTAIYYAQMTGVNYGANTVFTIPAGTSPVSLINKADTTKYFYNGSVTSNGGDVYSLFIGGAEGEDILMDKDNIPYYADSSIGIRFINLSYNSTPVNVTLSTSSTVNEFSNIAYKSISDFKNYTTRSISSYTFQVLDASNNIIVSTSVTTAEPRIHHSVTLVFRGMIGGIGSTAPGLFVVNNY